MITMQKIDYLPNTWQDPTPESPKIYPWYLTLVQFAFNALGRLWPRAASRVAYRLFTTPRVRAKHRVSDPLIERARVFEVLYGGRMLKAYEWGQGERTVLLVHGWESRGTALRSFVPGLLEQGFRVLTFDAPGHGHSAGKRTNLPHFAGAVRALINYSGGVHGIITHSFGGASTVYALAHLMPEERVSKLVLIGVPNRMTTVFENAADTLNMPQAARAFFKKMTERRLGMSAGKAELAIMGQSMRLGEALIVHDRQDAAVPFAEAEATAAAWPNASLLVSDGYGHFRLMKHPELVRRVVAFME